jgi:hypothetical protein
LKKIGKRQLSNILRNVTSIAENSSDSSISAVDFPQIPQKLQLRHRYVIAVVAPTIKPIGGIGSDGILPFLGRLFRVVSRRDGVLMAEKGVWSAKSANQ